MWACSCSATVVLSGGIERRRNDLPVAPIFANPPQHNPLPETDVAKGMGLPAALWLAHGPTPSISSMNDASFAQRREQYSYPPEDRIGSLRMGMSSSQ